LTTSYQATSGAVATSPLVAGIHLSGPNSGKTSLVILSRATGTIDQPFEVLQVYEKIATFGTLFSDDRLVDILDKNGPFAAVFVDCPLSLPPCVACQRPICPGVMSCEDVSVAWMMSMSQKSRHKKSRRTRPLNPQSQRLWDVLQTVSGEGDRPEPTYSANLAPLVTRARTLQRRLNGLKPPLILRETNVPHALDAWQQTLSLPEDVRLSYRNFERGQEVREAIVKSWRDRGMLKLKEPQAALWHPMIRGSVEVFHALTTALVSAAFVSQKTVFPPTSFTGDEGWVYLPKSDVELPHLSP